MILLAALFVIMISVALVVFFESRKMNKEIEHIRESMRQDFLTRQEIMKLPVRTVSAEEEHDLLEDPKLVTVNAYRSAIVLIPGEIGYTKDFRYVRNLQP
jgi:hypothetical protein